MASANCLSCTEIARFAHEIRAERVVCLTATATPRVASDICRAFNINETEGLFRTSTYRSNLHLLAESGKTKKELYPSLIKFLKDNRGATIVYVTLQKQTEELATELRKGGFNARSFHAGMDTATKTRLQDDFMRADDLIIVATIAFGMGAYLQCCFARIPLYTSCSSCSPQYLVHDESLLTSGFCRYR